MNKCIILAILLVLTGCSTQYPLNTDLQLQMQPATMNVYSSGETASITGIDSRKNKEVVQYSINEGAQVGITNFDPPENLVVEKLTEGLHQQGLLISSASAVRIAVDIKELFATVSRINMIYETEVETSIGITFENNSKKFGRNFHQESNRESLSKPDVDEVEALLEMQLSDILTQILDDEILRKFLLEQ